MDLSHRQRLFLSILLVSIASMVLWDARSDFKSGGSFSHIGIEVTTALLALAGVLALWLHLFALQRNLQFTREQLEKSEREATKWRSENANLIAGLGSAIERQLNDWGLSAAEKEISLLLLKGLSLKEIATLRDTSERTVRQQTLAIYSKSGLKGRAELSAFFLEDLLDTPGHSIAPSHIKR